jgi:HD-GYP domain-containing protein (c-di-GMP phosphodiesterase class II)
VHLSPARQAIYKQIKGSIGEAQKQTRAGISYSDYCSTTRDLIDTLLTQGQNPIYLDQMSRQGGDAVAHAASVAHLSLLLGLKLEMYVISQRSRLPAHRAKDLVNLGVAGMLHDLGISKLPEALQRYSDAELPEDPAALAEWQTHSALGYEMVRNDVEPTAAAAVYQHHQHYDGSGFPALEREGASAPMNKDRIHIFARIILCANLYDRLASPSSQKQRRSNAQVHQLMRTKFAGWFDPEIFRVFRSVVPPYPPGSRLRLTDGSKAIVTDVRSEEPEKPIVRRLDSDNWTPVGEPIDLVLPGAPQIEVEAAA